MLCATQACALSERTTGIQLLERSSVGHDQWHPTASGVVSRSQRQQSREQFQEVGLLVICATKMAPTKTMRLMGIEWESLLGYIYIELYRINHEK